MSIQKEGIESITVFQLAEMLKRPIPPLILDVREVEELRICALPTYIHIPLGALQAEAHRLPAGQGIVTLCHHGRRSLQAALWLKSQGFEQVWNLAGGIHAWAEHIDPSLERY